MKSLVEEASSISKAIEKAWARAGKPHSFSVKIYEEPQSGFLGFNSKPAKIGIFFEEEVSRQERDHSKKPFVSTGSRDRAPQRDGERYSRPSNREHSRDGAAPVDTRDARDSRDSRSSSHDAVREPRDNDSRPSRDGGDRRRRPQDSRGRGPRPGGSRSGGDRPYRQDAPRRDFEERNESSEPRVESSVDAPVAAPRPAAAPVAPAAVQTVRKILKVSSRRYHGPKKDEQ